MLLIVRDTREQLPLSFDHCSGVERIEDLCLPFGDYAGQVGADKDSLKHLPIVFERKSINDLWGTMTSGYDRFKREMERAKEAKHKLVILIEGNYSDILRGSDHSHFSGEAMVKKLSTLYVKYDLEWWPCENRRQMAQRIVDTFSAIERCWEKETK